MTAQYSARWMAVIAQQRVLWFQPGWAANQSSVRGWCWKRGTYQTDYHVLAVYFFATQIARQSLEPDYSPGVQASLP